LLIVLVGTATRLAQFLGADEKEYVADVRLGTATPTYDAASLEKARDPATEARDPKAQVKRPTDAELEGVLSGFRGSFLQTPPPHSAKKVAGVAAYERARKNQPVELRPVPVTVRELEVLSRNATLVRLRVAAGAGFYVRSLANDIGQVLGCGAHLEALRRTRAGRFRVEDALTLDRLESEAAGRLIPASELLGHMPAVSVTEDGERRVHHGNPLAAAHVAKGDSRLFSQMTGAAAFFRVLNGAGRLVAVAEPRPGGVLQPVVVLR